MGSMLGADPGQLEDLGRRMDGAANRLDAIRADVTADLNHSHWEGGDADDFRADWSHRLSGLLHTAALAAREAGTILRRNAHQQREASGAGGVPWADVGAGSTRAGGGSAFDNFLDDADVLFKNVDRFYFPYDTAGKLFELFPALGAGAIAVLPKPLGALVSRAAQDLYYKVPVEDFIKGGPGLNAAAHRFEKIGPLAPLTTAFDAAGLVRNLIEHPLSSETTKSVVDVAFDAAEIATAECLPASLALGLAHTGVDYLWDHPEVRMKVIDGISTVGQQIGQAEFDAVAAGAHVAEAGAHVVEDAASAAAHVVSGGVNAVLNRIHL